MCFSFKFMVLTIEEVQNLVLLLLYTLSLNLHLSSYYLVIYHLNLFHHLIFNFITLILFIVRKVMEHNENLIILEEINTIIFFL